MQLLLHLYPSLYVRVCIARFRDSCIALHGIPALRSPRPRLSSCVVCQSVRRGVCAAWASGGCVPSTRTAGLKTRSPVRTSPIGSYLWNVLTLHFLILCTVWSPHAHGAESGRGPPTQGDASPKSQASKTRPGGPHREASASLRSFVCSKRSNQSRPPQCE